MVMIAMRLSGRRVDILVIFLPVLSWVTWRGAQPIFRIAERREMLSFLFVAVIVVDVGGVGYWGVLA